MTMFKKRYALVGWFAWRVGKRRLKRQVGKWA
jgi:hypothetical protein